MAEQQLIDPLLNKWSVPSLRFAEDESLKEATL